MKKWWHVVLEAHECWNGGRPFSRGHTTTAVFPVVYIGPFKTKRAAMIAMKRMADSRRRKE